VGTYLRVYHSSAGQSGRWLSESTVYQADRSPRRGFQQEVRIMKRLLQVVSLTAITTTVWSAAAQEIAARGRQPFKAMRSA
jgi:hypothetical protein